MSQKLQQLTNGTYTLSETEKENQLVFFRNDHEVIGSVGTTPLELFGKYLIDKARKGEVSKRYSSEVFFEISNDGKIIRMTVSEYSGKHNLRIVNSGKNASSDAAKQQPSFFKRMVKKWTGKG